MVQQQAASYSDLIDKAETAAEWAARQTDLELRLIAHRDPEGTYWTLWCSACGKVAPLPIGAGSVAGPRSKRWETLDRRPKLSCRNRGRALDSLHRHAVNAHRGVPFLILGSAA